MRLLQVLRIQTRGMPLGADVDLAAIAAATDMFTGASPFSLRLSEMSPPYRGACMQSGVWALCICTGHGCCSHYWPVEARRGGRLWWRTWLMRLCNAQVPSWRAYAGKRPLQLCGKTSR